MTNNEEAKITDTEIQEKLEDLARKLDKEDKDFTKGVKEGDKSKLEQMVLTYNKVRADVDYSQANNKELRKAQSDVSVLKSGYKKQRDAAQRKLDYILLTLRTRGELK